MPEWVRLQAAAGADDVRLVASVLLSTADAGLAELTDSRPRFDDVPGLREAAAAARIRVLRRLAVSGAPYGLRGPVRPEDWFTETTQTALEVVQLLLDDERPDSALLIEGGLLLELARHYRGEGPVARAADEQDRIASRAYAERADEDLHAGIDGLDWEAVPGTQLCRAWLDYADAIEFAHETPDDDDRLRILQALDQARQHVGKDEDALADILLRMARVLEQRYASTGGWAHRDSAIAAWTEAVPLLPWNDPGRAVVLTSLGRQLTERGVDKDSSADIHAAVRALRGAIEQTPAADPELPRRRALLGHAYIERFRADETVADLHEADWALGATARAAGDPELAAYAWWYRALASALLAQRTASHPKLQDAAAHYRRAAASPARASCWSGRRPPSGCGRPASNGRRAPGGPWRNTGRCCPCCRPRAPRARRPRASSGRRSTGSKPAPDSPARLTPLTARRACPARVRRAGPFGSYGQASKTSLSSCCCSAW